MYITSFLHTSYLFSLPESDLPEITLLVVDENKQGNFRQV